jgi:hypothetical protein
MLPNACIANVAEPVVILDLFPSASGNRVHELAAAGGGMIEPGRGHEGIVAALEQLARTGKLPRRKIVREPLVPRADERAKVAARRTARRLPRHPCVKAS